MFFYHMYCDVCTATKSMNQLKHVILSSHDFSPVPHHPQPLFFSLLWSMCPILKHTLTHTPAYKHIYKCERQVAEVISGDVIVLSVYTCTV